VKIYLAGPMRGIPYFNHEAFRSGAAFLRLKGHEVFNPVESSEAMYGPEIYRNSPHGDETLAGIDGRKVFFADLEYICKEAEAVALLQGWEKSKGATAERAVALALGLKLIFI
jgi:hypothetical protein